MSVPKCSECANDDVQRVSAVVNAETRTSTSEGFAWQPDKKRGYRWTPYTERKTEVSHLAGLLAAPQQPVAGMVAVIVLGVVLLMGAAYYAAASALAGLLGGALSNLAGILFAVMLLSAIFGPAESAVRKCRKRCQERMAVWEKQMKKWERLYYCRRCDRVFDPETGKSASPRAMHSLL